MLKETARRLEKLLRKTDRLVRWGGEEFLVLSLDCRRAEASDLAMRIITAVSGQPFAVGPPGGIAVTTSIGWAAYPFSAAHSDLQPEDAVRLADRALYRAKRGGRNCAVGIVDTEDPVGQDGKLTGTVEILRDFGFSVGFRLARGAAQTGGKNIESLQGSGPRRRPPMA